MEWKVLELTAAESSRKWLPAVAVAVAVEAEIKAAGKPRLERVELVLLRTAVNIT